MPGLDPGIHLAMATWIAGSSPAMTSLGVWEPNARDTARAPTARLKIEGVAEIGFVARHGRTRLGHLYQHDPLRVLFPDAPVGELPVAVLLTTSGGLVGGDRLAIAVDVGPNASAHVTAQAAEKIYRSAGPDSALEIALRIGTGGRLEYLPPETILFDGARLYRRATVDLAADAVLLAGEILVFGRIASGERMASGLVHDSWELRRGGRLIWGDSFHLGDDSMGSLLSKAADPACLDGAAACATLLLAAPDGARFLAGAREAIAASGVRGGATLVGGVLVMRLLAAEAAPLRRAYVALAGHLRAAQAGLPAQLPGLWHV